MTREEYIQYRSENNPEPIYEVYKEGYDAKKHKVFLSRGDFFQSIQMWLPANKALHDTYAYFDIKFEVMRITDKVTGEIIKFV